MIVGVALLEGQIEGFAVADRADRGAGFVGFEDVVLMAWV